jgi:hypothetical protein
MGLGLPGKDQFFSLDNAAGSPQDISSKITDIQVPTEWDLEDTTTLGDTGHENTPTLSNGSISLTLIWDTTLEAHLGALQGLSATSTYVYAPNGNTTGKRRITGDCRLQNYQVGSPVGGVVQATATLQFDGGYTREAVP